MEILVKKTTELTELEKKQICNLFNTVFVKSQRGYEEVMNQYENTPMGYCIHSLCIDKGSIVAAHTAFPSYYWFGEKKVKAFITGDTMVRKDYRDGVTFLDVVRGLNKYMKKEGYAFSFGFPNDNSYPVFKKLKLAKDIGRLDTYILPYRIGGIKKGLRWLNPLSKIFCMLWLTCSGVRLNKSVFKPLIHKDDETYNHSRYKRMDGNYTHVKNQEVEFYYKIKKHEGVRTAFLIDVLGKSEISFYRAVKYLISEEKTNADLFMYVGYLPKTIRKIGLIKIPRRYEPKHFYMTGCLYDKESLYEKDLFNIFNWDINLSNYDII